jgi:replicative DNA helicase
MAVDLPDEGSTTPRAPRPTPATFDAVAYLSQTLDNGGAEDGIASGFPSVDSLLGGGFRRGDVVVIGGDVGSGKSALALGMALRVAEVGGAVAVFSGELSADRLTERALAIQGRVRVDDLRHARLDESQHATVAAAALRLRERPLMLSHLPPNGVSGLSDLLIEYLGLDLVVVDPLQSLATGHHEMEEELAQAMRDLKGLAVRRNCVVLVVAHLIHGVRGRDDPRPRLDDFGALGTIRQLSDVVMGVFREEMYDAANDVDGAAEIHVLKHRGGGTGYADLYFYKRWLRFEDMVEPDR